MNTLKPLFICAALGLALVVVYSAISRPPDSDHVPPHVEGLAIPSTNAPLVQMPGNPSLVSPFGATSPASTQPQDAWAGSSHAPVASPGPGTRYDARPSVYPGESLYPSAGDHRPPNSPSSDRSHPELQPSGRDSAASPYPAAPIAAHPSAPPWSAPPTGTLDCESGCTVAPPSRHSGADAEAPAWPSSQAAAGLAPPYQPPPRERNNEAPRYAGSSSTGREPVGDNAQSQQDIEQAFQRLLDQVYRELDAGRLVEAHLVLSRFYRKPGLTPRQARQVTELLDQLAGTVIYSRHSLLEPVYVVRPGDTLESIADRYDVPPALIANINGIRNPRGVQPGEELKVVRGPFHAIVHLDDYELTMMLGEYYAGRFPVSVGRDHPNLEGSYVVADKGVGPTYYGPDDTTFAEHDPHNPLGRLWLGLGERAGQAARIGIHGTNDPKYIGRDAPRGNIGLDRRDIEDVYGILSVGSRVVIQR